MKRRFKRGLALLLTLCLLGGNLAFAEELPETVEEPVIKEETVAEKEEAVPGGNAENADVEAEDELETSEENVPEPVRGSADTIYLNGQSGDDTKDGSTPENAVKTFGQAKTLATNNQGITKIVVIGTTNIEGDITLEGTKAKILRGENFNDYVFKVPAGKSATLKNITIDGNSENNPNITASLISAESDSTLSIQEGTLIRKNKIEKPTNYSNGGGILASGATVEMTGGTIEENAANYGGGIALIENSKMNFSGGTIQKNHAKYIYYTGHNGAGGGIMLTGLSTLHMSGNASVSENKSDRLGGGISVGNDFPDKGATFLMTGGSIASNESDACGGGLYIQTGISRGVYYRAFISAGKIVNNVMTGKGKGMLAFGGGGIYVNGFPDELHWESNTYYGQNGELYLANAVITNNAVNGLYEDGELGKIASDGGGYAACPISKTVIHVTDGVAIYKNDAQIQGKDLYILGKAKYDLHGGIPTYELAERMLGGAPWNWKQEDNQLLPLDKYTGKLQDNEELALHTDFKGSEWVNKLGTVLIAGNTSVTRGGGIGSNGSVFFGTDGETTEVTVEKQWEDEGNSGTRPKEIKVQLWAKLDGEEQEYPVAEETVTAAEHWKVTFKNLQKYKYPKFKVENNKFVPDGERQKIIYSVKEVPVPGYTSEVTGNAKDGFLINNKRKPETPPPTPSEKFIEIPVEKIWQDDGHEEKRPTEITVTLYADGVATDKTLVLSAANEWKGVFRHLPEKKDGKSITYTVKEVEVNGYESVRTGNQSDGFVLTNTYKPEKPPTPPTPPTPPIPSIPFVRIPRAGA